MALVALASLGVTLLVWLNAARFVPSAGAIPSDEVFYGRAMCRLTVLLAGSFVAAFALVPSLAATLALLRRRWTAALTAITLIAACVVQAGFVIHAGRWQFGAFDAGNLMQEGWRETLGQRPYTDFLATTPPAFNLGLLYAFRLFGVSWDANLYLAAIFTCVTFLWLYWLLIRLSLGRFASLAMAFAIECAAMLTLSFWWYNNVTTVLAAVLFLSALLLARDPGGRSAQASYVLSLALTALTKPNMAGIAIFGCVVVLLLAADRRVRTLVLTVAAAVLAVAILLLNHISLPAMLHSYRAVAVERGFAAIGFRQMNTYQQVSSFLWIPLLALPLYALGPRLRSQLHQREWRPVTLTFFYLAGPVLAVYGVITNGESREVECTVLLAAGGVVAFGLRWNRPMVTRVYIAVLAASIAGDLYQGVQRLRIYDGGPHLFFEWQDNRNAVPIAGGVLDHLRVSQTMLSTEQQVALTLQRDPGPYWFGPRLDFNNAVFHLPMPAGLPAWWHPGTAFSRTDVPRLLDLWQQQNYQTLIFLRGDPYLDYIYYPQPFLDLIHRDYIADDSHPFLTVYHRRKSPAAYHQFAIRTPQP